MSPLEDLITVGRESPFTDEDRINHTTKMIERTFGRPVSDLGAVEVRDGRGVLVFDYNGASHTLRWARQPGGGIFWFLDDRERPIVLGSSEKALQRLYAALEG